MDLEIERFCIKSVHFEMACRIPQRNDDILERTVSSNSIEYPAPCHRTMHSRRRLMDYVEGVGGRYVVNFVPCFMLDAKDEDELSLRGRE